MSQPYERITDDLSTAAGIRPLPPAEATALLALARAVAHTSDDRRAAPLVCYLAGVLLAEDDDEASRVRRIEQLAARYVGSDPDTGAATDS